MFTGAANRARPGCSRPSAGLPEASVPAIGRVAEKGPDPASAPRLLAAARRTALPLQAAADLAEAEAVAANPSEDLADHLCFVRNCSPHPTPCKCLSEKDFPEEGFLAVGSIESDAK
jgi:hypothetical protein